jgi:3',5'-cyclic AMP phosphodiesterase CpdA
LARAVAEFAYSQRLALDGIVITGDLATTGGMLEDLNVAISFVNSPAVLGVRSREGNPTLAASGLNIFLIPGNHDRYATELGGCGGTNFDEIFEAYWERGSHIQSAVLEIEDQKLGIVGADFTLCDSADAKVPRVLGRLGQGRVYPDILSALEEETNALRREFGPIGLIWAVHFPPEAPGNTRGLRLIDGRSLIAAAKRQDVRHILAGHIHSDQTYTAGTKPTVRVFCANSACSLSTDGGNGFQVLEIDVDGTRVSISEQCYEWDDEVGEFILH